MQNKRKSYRHIYNILLAHFGPQGWWPVTPAGGESPLYSGGPRTDAGRLEVVIGAILTQNTSWHGAGLALVNLTRNGCLNFIALRELAEGELAGLIKSSGYYNQKAKKIKRLINFLWDRYGADWPNFFSEPVEKMRSLLLNLNGIGPETADSVILYAAGRPSFVIDNYTRRLFYRLGLTPENIDYAELKKKFEENLPSRSDLYGEYHALLVKHGKDCCRARSPVCERCPLDDICQRKGVESTNG